MEDIFSFSRKYNINCETSFDERLQSIAEDITVLLRNNDIKYREVGTIFAHIIDILQSKSV